MENLTALAAPNGSNVRVLSKPDYEDYITVGEVYLKNGMGFHRVSNGAGTYLTKRTAKLVTVEIV